MTLPLFIPLFPASGPTSAQASKRPSPVALADPVPAFAQPAAPCALTELLTSAPRQHALRLNPPTPPQAQPTAAPQARHAHD